MTVIDEQVEVARQGFPSPFEVPTPPGCEGWEEMYAVPHPVQRGSPRLRRESLLVPARVHNAEPFYPFDAVFFDYADVALNQANSRLFVVPPSLGVEYRVLNGYVYFSTNSVTDEATLARRAELFAKRGGYYYEHWDELYARWLEKVEQAIRELEALAVAGACSSSRTRRL